jgi:PAS domain S-box-containing protein
MTNPLEYQPDLTPNIPAAPAHELDILYSAIAKLADAQTCEDVLNAITDYPRSSGAAAGVMAYIHGNSDNLPESWEVAAEWGNTATYLRGTRGIRNPLDQTLFAELIAPGPHQPILISDMTLNPKLDSATRERCQQAQIYGLAFLPLCFRDHWTGFLIFSWDQPHQFRKQDQRLYTAFARQISIVAQNPYFYRQVQKVEQSLQDQTNFLQNLIDYIPNPVFYKDVKGLYQGFNKAFAIYYGKSREEVIGKSVYDLNPPELADIYYTRDQEIFQNPDKVQVYESPLRYADGTIHTVIYTKASVKNRDGSVWGLLGVITDITERRRAEEALRDNEVRLSLIMENSQEAILLMDIGGNILLANPAACHMFGRSQAEMLTLKHVDLIDMRDIRAHRFNEEAIKTGKARAELTAFQKDHTPFPVEVTVGVYKNGDGQQFGAVTVHDLSNHYRLQQVLIEEETLRAELAKETELSQLKTRMMNQIAHTFRTPLTVIQASAETLEVYLDRLDPDQRVMRLQNIYSQVQQLSHFLTQIGLVMNGNLAPENVYFSQVDINLLCRQIARELETKYARPATFVLDVPDYFMFYADLAALRNILLPVMQNALHYSAPDSPVKVSLSRLDHAIELTVTDSGIGIPPQEQEHIFDAFFRGSNIGITSGLGLGLTIAKACAELHHGTIKVESAPAKGTTIRIRLPQTSAT